MEKRFNLDTLIITDNLLFPEGPIYLEDGTLLVVEIARGTLTKIFQDGKKDIVCEKKEELSVKGIFHKIQTYQISDKSKNLEKKNLLLNEEYEGFNLNIDLNIAYKDQVISSLEGTLSKIKKSMT